MTRFGLQATGSVAGYRGAGELGGTGAVATAGVHLARDEMLWKVLRMTLADGRLVVWQRLMTNSPTIRPKTSRLRVFCGHWVWRCALEHVWLKSYPAGVPAEIDPDSYPSVAALLEEVMRQYADRDAVVCLGKVLRYGELDRLSAQFAAWLQSLSLARGSRVALMMPNCHAYVVALIGVMRAGMAAVNVNPLYTPRELAHQLKDSGAEILLVMENFAHTVEKVLAQTAVRQVVLVSMGDLLGPLKGWMTNFVVRRVKKMVPAFRLPGAIRFGEVMSRGARFPFRAPEVASSDVAVLQYTGGTTGVSKGAMLTQRNIVANVLQDCAWFHPAMDQPGRPRPEGAPVFVTALPLYHIYAFTICMLVGLHLGGKLILIPNPRDVDAVVKALKPHKVVVFPGLSTLYNMLMGHEGFRQLDFSNLRISLAGGMAVPSAVAARWQEVTGCPVCEGYGMTETSPTVACTPTDTTLHDGTAGLPLPSTEIRILDENQQPLPVGQEGEVAVRGPQLMAGYWQREAETKQFMTPDGFFRTGDVGVLDERGFLRLLDRKKDMILVSGFNVYANEVEDVVLSHPGVKECAVVGVEDERSGQAVKAFVVRRDGALDEAALQAHCAERLTGYKRPRIVSFVKALPKSDVGKVLRRQLRDGTVVPEVDGR